MESINQMMVSIDQAMYSKEHHMIFNAALSFDHSSLNTMFQKNLFIK